MLTQLTHDITAMSRRRWLAATAGLVLGLATFSNAKAADDTIKAAVGPFRSVSRLRQGDDISCLLNLLTI